jgi:hypothetical protein
MVAIAIPIVGAVALGGLALLRLKKLHDARTAIRPAAPSAAAIASVPAPRVTPAAAAAAQIVAPTAVPPNLFEFPDEATGAQQAIVTTHDPAPAGDLIIRSSPSASGAQVGMAEKDGVVTVIRDVDGTFAEISWEGGDRRPAARGFSKKQFLKLLPVGTKVRQADIALNLARAAMQANPTPETIAAATAAAIEAEPLEHVEQSAFTGESRRKRRR